MKCMQTNFGGRSLSCFGDLALFCLPSKTAKISFSTMAHGGQKIESAQKIHASRGCYEMHATNFCGCSISRFGDLAPFCLPSKTAKISFSTMGVKK